MKNFPHHKKGFKSAEERQAAVKEVLEICDRTRCAVWLLCDECGHKQHVIPASVFTENGKKVGVFGSRYFHCDRCDGMKLTETTGE